MVINKGFTILELMVVVAIIGIFLAIAHPAYQEHENRRLLSTSLLTTQERVIMTQLFTKLSSTDYGNIVNAINMTRSQLPPENTVSFCDIRNTIIPLNDTHLGAIRHVYPPWFDQLSTCVVTIDGISPMEQ